MKKIDVAVCPYNIAFFYRKKNYAALPCPVTNTSSVAMQKQLVQIKKEKFEMDTDSKENNLNSDRVRKEMAEEESSRESSNNVVKDAPPVSTSAVSSPMPTLDEILKKYKFTTGTKLS